ncbi:sybindin-like family protein, putative [Babesia bigemina]|uniref:Trafficking protein particle complex subunit n=1 Tax=Babesia bigemina TaxID=5866 RepID=A0A061D8K3_BABBI|nr:sybindin-like family protein, putative [Babesia bigemina]CDR96843.1 sybindin-like family protein, putative [Babesia bigemina]|eukprot:XP_012769029.1 sybindin-like family protein, putative [Babesia bigemina]
MAMIALFITNQHGSLIYYKSLNGRDAFSSNDAIRLASTLHGLSTIAPKLCVPNSAQVQTLLPQPKGNGFRPPPERHAGITCIESSSFRLQCYETLTGRDDIGPAVAHLSLGLKICIVCTPQGPSREHVNVILSYVYELYADFVQKCPFHQTDMPVRSELFDDRITAYFAELST